MREPLGKSARERCSCGRVNLPPVQWSDLARALRDRREPLYHKPARLGGCGETEPQAKGFLDNPARAARLGQTPVRVIIAQRAYEQELKVSAADGTASVETGQNGESRPAAPPLAPIDIERPPQGTVEPVEPLDLDEKPQAPPKHIPWYQRKDETGLFLDIASTDPKYGAWRREVGLTLKRYLQKHEQFFADDFWRESGLKPYPGMANAFSGVTRAAVQAGWIDDTGAKRQHIGTSPVSGRPNKSGRYYTVWKSLLYPDKEPSPRVAAHKPGKRDEPVRRCKIEGCGRLLRSNNFSGVCFLHRMMMPKGARYALIPPEVRARMQEVQERNDKMEAAVKREEAPAVAPEATMEIPSQPKRYCKAAGCKKRLGSQNVLGYCVHHKMQHPEYAAKIAKAQKLGNLASRGKAIAREENGAAVGVNNEPKLPIGRDGLITTARLAKAIHRSTGSVLDYGRSLGFQPTYIRGSSGRPNAGWTEEQAKKIAHRMESIRRYTVPRGRAKREPSLTNGAPERTRASGPGGHGEQVQSSKGFAGWLKLQLERAGITYAHFEKGQILIRKERVITEEETV